MKICWDNLEMLKYRPDRNQWQSLKQRSHFYTYKETCKTCGEPFLSRGGDYCCEKCAGIDKVGNKNPAKRSEIRRKISKNKMGQGLGVKRPEHSEWMKQNCPMKRPEVATKFAGDKNPNWKGGIACEPYCEVWLDKEFKQSIMKRDGNKCLNPYHTENNSDILLHHINYNKKDCRPVNLITICRVCNLKANYDRNWHQAWYETLIDRRYGK